MHASRHRLEFSQMSGREKEQREEEEEEEEKEKEG